MRDRVVDLLEKVDLALATSRGVIADELLAPIAAVRDLIQTRLAYPDDVVVVGLAGGTGSGKSSLLNAVAGIEVAETGGVRPTTSTPLALVPVARADAMAGYLEKMSVEAGDNPSPIDWLCLIDLPDIDSIVVDNRLTVDRLLPILDLVIWVLDPEKYRDAASHSLIAQLAEYSSQFVFAVNQVDRVQPGEAEAIRADLVSALADDGVANPAVALVAAAPPAGPSIGIDGLIELVQTSAGDEAAVYTKLLADVHAASTALVQALSGSGGLDYEARWKLTVEAAAASLKSDRPSEAAHAAVGLLDALGREAGGPTGEKIASLIPLVPAVVDAATGTDVVPRGRKWPWSRREEPAPVSADVVLRNLEARIGEPVRAALARRAAAASAISDLHLSVLATRGSGGRSV